MRLDPESTVRAARDAYLDDNGFDMAAYTSKTFALPFLGREIHLPNPPARQRARRQPVFPDGDDAMIVAQRRPQRLDQPPAPLERKEGRRCAGPPEHRQGRAGDARRRQAVARVEVGMIQVRIARAQRLPDGLILRTQGVRPDDLQIERFGHGSPGATSRETATLPEAPLRYGLGDW